MRSTRLKIPIGCFGGSFNPPHTAHFTLAHSACEQLGLAQVLIIPAGQPWQKPHVLSTKHRINMLHKALQNDMATWFKNGKTNHYPLTIDTIESDLEQASYTINTLQTLRTHYPDTPLVWIMGSDQLNNLHTWHRWQDLLDYSHIAVAQRAGHEVQIEKLVEPLRHIYQERVIHDAKWQHTLSGHFIPFTLPALHISSSAIRKAIQNGVPTNDLPELHIDVAHYINAHHLYQHQETT